MVNYYDSDPEDGVSKYAEVIGECDLEGALREKTPVDAKR